MTGVVGASLNDTRASLRAVIHRDATNRREASRALDRGDWAPAGAAGLRLPRVPGGHGVQELQSVASFAAPSTATTPTKSLAVLPELPELGREAPLKALHRFARALGEATREWTPRRALHEEEPVLRPFASAPCFFDDPYRLTCDRTPHALPTYGGSRWHPPDPARRHGERSGRRLLPTRSHQFPPSCHDAPGALHDR